MSELTKRIRAAVADAHVVLHEGNWVQPLEIEANEIADAVLPLLIELTADRDRLRAGLVDIAEHGLRADLTPTIDGSRDIYAQMTYYLRRLDTTLRSRARRALDGDPS